MFEDNETNQVISLFSNDSSSSIFRNLRPVFVSNFDVLASSFSIAALLISILLLDTPSYALVYRARLKLVRVEFYILTFNSACILAIKLVSLASAFKYIFVGTQQDEVATCSVFFVLRLLTFWCYLCVFFYYSLFHLASSLRSANAWLRRLVDLVLSVKLFLAYFAFVSIVYACVLVVYTSVLRARLFTYYSDDGCLSNGSYFEIIAPTFAFNISFLTVLVYLLGIVLLIVWNRPKRTQQQTQSTISPAKKRIFYKNLIIFIKFFLFSCFSSLLTLCLNFIFSMPYFDSHSADPNEVGFKIALAFFNFSVFFHPIFFIYTHNLLREKFTNMFCRR